MWQPILLPQNCGDVGFSCAEDGWSPFIQIEPDSPYEYEICSDILLNPEQNPDKLLYYNRVLTADPVDDTYKYRIEHPEGIPYRAPAKYDFRSNPNAEVLIFYFALQDWGTTVIQVDEISIAFVLSDGPPPTKLEDVVDEFAEAQAAYDALSEDNKEFFREPDLFNFELGTGLQDYRAYLPR